MRRTSIYRQLVERTVVIQEHASDFTVYLLCPEEDKRWPDLAHIAWLDDEHPGRLARASPALSHWAPPAVVLMPDLPLLCADDLSAMLKQTQDLVWIPDRSGHGTNGMIWRAGPLPCLAFGRPDSARPPQRGARPASTAAARPGRRHSGRLGRLTGRAVSKRIARSQGKEVAVIRSPQLDRWLRSGGRRVTRTA